MNHKGFHHFFAQFSTELLLGVQKLVEFFHKFIRVGAVHRAGVLNGFGGGAGAAQTVHSNAQEQGSGLGGDGQNITDDGVLGNRRWTFSY